VEEVFRERVVAIVVLEQGVTAARAGATLGILAVVATVAASLTADGLLVVMVHTDRVGRSAGLDGIVRIGDLGAMLVALAVGAKVTIAVDGVCVVLALEGIRVVLPVAGIAVLLVAVESANRVVGAAHGVAEFATGVGHIVLAVHLLALTDDHQALPLLVQVRAGGAAVARPRVSGGD
jgi:hypothetical protein